RFFWWNDMYFMQRCQEVRFKHLINDWQTNELTEMLMYRRAPKTVHHPLFQHKIMKAEHDDREKNRLIKQIRAKVEEFESALKKHGTGKEWILADLPEKDVVFTRDLDYVVKRRTNENLFR